MRSGFCLDLENLEAEVSIFGEGELPIGECSANFRSPRLDAEVGWEQNMTTTDKPN